MKTIKPITSRKLFTRHRLHMNYKGKEMLIKEIVGKMMENASRCKRNVICLPWKKELETTTNNYHTVPHKQSNEVTTLTIDITGNTKVIEEIKTQEVIDKKLYKIPSVEECGKEGDNSRKSSKPQRNCPKQKNEDYLWN